ncbi:MAG: gliding motility protein [Terriglobia bacterium]
MSRLSFIERFVKVISGDQPAEFWSPLQEALYEALCLLAARVQALGLSEKIRARSPHHPVRQNPFFRLSRTVDAILFSLQNQGDFGFLLPVWQNTLADCRKELEAINQKLETAGVNLDLVYSVDVLHQSLERMEAIIEVLSQPSGLPKIRAVKDLLSLVIKGRLADRSLMELGSNGMRLLATKIVEQAGKTGEHYITVTRRDYSAMWKAGLGGGVLTAVTAALKLPITHSGFPPFLEGMLAGMNYAFSFILIQSFHFVLATKQPSMTAAAFAGIIKKHQGVSRLNELVTYIARICRSQLAAAMANVTAVTVICTLFALIWKTGKGAPYLSTEEADHLFHSLSPFVSGTIFYAALTGVILWFSSIVGGWIDNWAIYRQLPQALAEHPLGMVWGKERLEKAARILAPNVAAWGGSIALGFMMGMTPPLGRFFGIPLDVRHVTLTTGTWALAAASLGRDWYAKGWFLEALLGIGVIFVLNLTVSFSIALLVALRAYDIPAKEHLQLLKQVFQRLLRTPREFLLPPKRSTNARTSSH